MFPALWGTVLIAINATQTTQLNLSHPGSSMPPVPENVKLTYILPLHQTVGERLRVISVPVFTAIVTGSQEQLM
jgi:hypothetical protein